MYLAKQRVAGSPGAVPLAGVRFGEDASHVERALAGAAKRGELRLLYQPIVTVDGQMTGVEALLRWTNPSLGDVPPSVLIPLAEHSGEIVAIGRWALEQAWSDRHRWQSQRSDGLSLSVNVSVPQFMSAGFVETVGAVLESTSVDPAFLTLEVTETVFLRGRERALVVLEDLKRLGGMLALDDFGTGYSSLNYLMSYSVDIIKIDRAFIAKLGRDPASHTIVSAVIQLAHDRRMTVVAEGVETAEQQRVLPELGCDLCQGFYFAQPMTAASLATLIQASADGDDLQLPRE